MLYRYCKVLIIIICMKKLMKGLFSITVKLFQSMVSLLSVLLFSSFKVGRSFKEMKKKISDSDVCYILANGPSLKSFLEKGDYPKKNIFVVNLFASSPYFYKLKPDNYIVADPNMCGAATGDFIDEVDGIYKIINGIDWDMNMFFPNDTPSFIIKKIENNPHIHVRIFNKTPVDGFKCVNYFLYKRSLGMPLAQNITNAAVFCAINAGYKKIYLYGMELSWLKKLECNPRTHRIYLNDDHFYEDDNMRYFERGEYCSWLLDIHKAMTAHFRLREYADLVGVKVINKTDYSFVEAYEFEEY